MTIDSLCYQGNNESTNYEYNFDPAIPDTYLTSCSTCASSGLTFFVRNDTLYEGMQVWSRINPLCAILAATNIGTLVSGGSMNGWDCDENMLASDYCSDWTGVSCSSDNAVITAIALNNMGLTGTLPMEISDLYYVTVLDFGNNGMSGTVPTGIGGVQTLSILDLSNNMFSGSLPIEMGAFVGLTTLSLNANKFEEQLPTQIGYLTNAVTMDFSSNSFTGSVPSQFCSDLALTYLNIENTNIDCYSKCLEDIGELVPGDANSCYTEFVAAEGSALCDFYAATNIPTLMEQEMIGGWNCTSSGEPVGDFCEWFGVYCGIDKSDDPAGGFADDIIVLNNTVYEINLPALKLEGTLPSSLSVLSYLLVLNVPDNNLTGTIPPEFGNLRELASVDVGYNSLTGSLPSTLGSLVNLQELNLMNNSLTGELPTYLGLLYSMYELSFRNNNFEGAVPNELCNDTALNTLDISYNPLITCYANCLTSVPNFANDLNVEACNYVSLPPLSEDSIMGIVIGVTIGAFLIAVGLTWYFARDKISWLIGEAHEFAIRMTESAENLLDDLDFSDIRASFAARHNTRPDMNDVMAAGRPAPLAGHEVKYENPVRGYHSSSDDIHDDL